MVKIIKNITTEAKLSKENEIMGKTLLRIIFKQRNISHPQEYKTEEEIAELLNNKDWKENNQFWLTSQGWISYKTVTRHQIIPHNITTSYDNKLGEQAVEISKLKKELEEKELLIENLESEMKIMEEGSLCHLDAIDTCKNWYFTHHVNPLKGEIQKEREEKKTFIKQLEKANERNKSHEEVIKNQQGRIDELLKNLEKISKKFEEKEVETEKLTDLYLLNKPFPKKPNKFRILGTKVKNKFSKLAEKVKHGSQEMVAQIEVRVK